MNTFKFTDSLGEINFDDGLRAKWEQQRLPYSALLELTAKCNMNCVHCYLQSHHMEADLPFKEIVNLIDILYEKEVLFLTFTGGEIFTRNDFADIYLYAKRKGFMIELFTNGLNISDRIIELLSKYPPILVDVSIYGASEETYQKTTRVSGAFRKVIDNCEKLSRANIRYALRTPVISFLKDEIPKIQKLADKLGVVFSTSYEISPTIDGNDISQQFQLTPFEVLKQECMEYFMKEERIVYTSPEYIVGGSKPIFTCKMGKGAFVIDYRGNMFPCMKFRHIAQKLNPDNFDSIWKSYDRLYSLRTKNDNPCNTCDAKFYCEICPAEMDFLFHDYEYRTPQMCSIARFRKKLYEGNFCDLAEATNCLLKENL